MSTTMFDSNTYGIGELITQRKLFAVPLHQRNYSWGDEQVEQFLRDIKLAFTDKPQDYFIGLMVLQGPTKGVWEVLDGQQRLTTVTMIYSAIRNWLKERSFDRDANQIEAEYLGVRHLGGEFLTRVRLNSLNHDLFDRHVIKASPTDEIRRERDQLARRTSNALLLGAALACRDWIAEVANALGDTTESKAKGLFRLSRFLETGVKVVTVDVATDADAYILFESLNNRGADLSALDLVKNYIFSIGENAQFARLEGMWERLTQSIEGSDADDFLKYFWTSRFGIIQKNDLFKKIRVAYVGHDAANRLLEELLDAADFAEALDEEDHPLWMEHSKQTLEHVSNIKAIGSKQARPVLYSAIKRLDESNLDQFLRDLTISLIRFQTIGHGRTGVLEKVLGRISPGLWQKQITDRDSWLFVLRELLASDEQFISDFNAHHEQKISRAHYLLKELEKHAGSDRLLIAESKIVYLPPEPSDDEEPYKKLGSYFILEKNLYSDYAREMKLRTASDTMDLSKQLFAASQFPSTNAFSSYDVWNKGSADDRTALLASAAKNYWKIN